MPIHVLQIVRFIIICYGWVCGNINYDMFKYPFLNCFHFSTESPDYDNIILCNINFVWYMHIDIMCSYCTARLDLEFRLYSMMQICFFSLLRYAVFVFGIGICTHLKYIVVV